MDLPAHFVSAFQGEVDESVVYFLQIIHFEAGVSPSRRGGDPHFVAQQGCHNA